MKIFSSDIEAVGAFDYASVDRMGDLEAANVLDGRVRALDRILRTAFIELGWIVSQYQRRELWKHVQSLDTGQTFGNFNGWLVSAAPYSRSHCYAAKGIVEELTKDVPIENLSGIDETNARVLVSVSGSCRSKLVKSARTLSGDDFVAKVQQDFPQLHIESKKKLVLTYSEGEMAEVERALDRVGRQLDPPIEDRAGLLLAWAIDANMEEGEPEE